jgi:hypothetical protein
MSRENALGGRMALATGVSRRKDIGFAIARELPALRSESNSRSDLRCEYLLPALRASLDDRSGDGLGMFRSLGLDDP